jgi:mannose-6-phosphate isomerase-like protein (cupin superfamily)
MIIKKALRKKELNTKNWKIWDYPISKDIGIAVQEISGRAPAAGATINKVCKEIVYVIRGSGHIFINGRKSAISEGDAFVISPEERSFITGKMRIITITSPDWYPRQCEKVEE